MMLRSKGRGEEGARPGNAIAEGREAAQVVYILDQVRALEREMLKRLKDAGLDITPHILVVSRLIPEAQGTTCNERLEHINGTQHAKILRCVAVCELEH